MILVWLALGSNLGESQQILQRAWHKLGEDERMSLCRLSHPYASEPVGMVSSNQFLNGVGLLETDYSPEDLLQVLQKMEKQFGRDKQSGAEGYQDRLLDLDILYYGDQVLSTSRLTIPHPHISERLFVLAPLAEIDPEHVDPVQRKTAEEMHRHLLQKIKAAEVPVQQIEQSVWDRKSVDIS
jgi:2-amino-4-hydroxy-6-hydroxymethyldihydropteridine diphosphokinase